ncbi:hypothetical protein NIES3275_78240 (plasmid) [Microchaete diplosiphon NIES-3275]|nr:hypothetical protein NIES3275_78240 [Microchaete diplosiphon NIES-3275]
MEPISMIIAALVLVRSQMLRIPQEPARTIPVQ